MSIVSAICAEHDRKIVSNEISLLKQKIRDWRPDAVFSRDTVVAWLESLEKTINSQIDE